jgi:transcriptional regulator with PAS, ATPase and Fis domain
MRLIQGVEGSKTRSGRPAFDVLHFEQSETLRALFVKSTETEKAFSPDGAFHLSPVLERVYKQAQLVSAVPKREVTVLIQGESGTGKEHLDHFLHAQSARKNKRFTAVNCAAISPALLESRLFGHKKSAFTGASQDQIGLFESCDGGTLFLDEIGDIGPEFQQSLLRVLQEGTVCPVGGNEAKRVDVKVMTATHQNLRGLCQEGKFRWDLFYRLTTVVLALPPLREYPTTEREALTEYLLKSRAVFFERKVLKLQKTVREKLLAYAFPGNIRELIHLIDRWYIFCAEEVRAEDVSAELLQNDLTHSWRLEDVEHQHIEKALKHFDYNLSKTSTQLGLAKNTLKTRIKGFGIPMPDPS